VELAVGQPIESSNNAINYVHFPDCGIVSVMTSVAGSAVEIGLIGREGVTGSAVILGVDRSPYESFVQVAGVAQRIRAAHLRELMLRSASLRRMLLRSVYLFGVQTTQTAIANARGKIEQRLARWLLMTHDRVDGDELGFTHKFLSLMLGVRRAGVTEALDLLERQGLIQRGRGVIAIFDRRGLRALAGNFYGLPETEMRRLTGKTISR
jgi:CRP-like cAMP-binding protein